jgi:hypothetical protein
MMPIPIQEEKKSNIREALELITRAGIEQAFAPLDPKLDYSAKLIQQAINVLHDELNRMYNDKV